MSIKLSAKSIRESIKKISAVYGTMAKKDDAVIVFQAAEGKGKDGSVVKGATLTLFNGSAMVSTKMTVEGDLSAPVELRLSGEFVSAVNALLNLSGDLTITPGKEVMLSVGDAKVTIPQKEAGIMPVPFEIAKPGAVKAQLMVSGEEFLRASNGVLFAALNEDSPVGGVSITATNGQLSLKATDGKRISEQVIPVLKSKFSEGTEEASMVLGPTNLKILNGNLGGGSIAIAKTDSHIVVQSGGDLWQLPLVKNNFPNQLFASVKAMVGTGGKVAVNVKSLLNAMDIVTVTADNSLQAVCELEVGGGKAVLYDVEHTASAPVEVQGDITALARFSVNYLRSCVRALPAESICMEVLPAICVMSADGVDALVALAQVKKPEPAATAETAEK